MNEYTITIETNDGVDVVTFNSPARAVEVIQSERAMGSDVTYTGDPFADFVAMFAAE